MDPSQFPFSQPPYSQDDNSPNLFFSENDPYYQYHHFLTTSQPFGYPPTQSPISRVPTQGSNSEAPLIVAETQDEETTKSNAGVRKWTVAEDKLLCSVWLNVSKDPVVGAGQKVTTFWNRILEEYNANRPAGFPERPAKGLKDRWFRISPAVTKWVGCYKKALQRRQSGAGDQDVIDVTHALFKNQYGFTFTMEHAWHYLKNEPKWRVIVDDSSSQGSKRSKNSSDGAYTPTGPMEPPLDLERPIGRDKAKAKAKAKAKGKTTTSDNTSQMRGMKLTDSTGVLTSYAQDKITGIKGIFQAKMMNAKARQYELLLKDTSNMTEKQRRRHELICDDIERTLAGVQTWEQLAGQQATQAQEEEEKEEEK